MNEDSQLVQISKRVRSLTIAVWVLVLITVLQASAWLVPLLAHNFVAGKVLSLPQEAFGSWEGLTLEEKIKRSSIIVLTENKTEGGKIRAIVKEVRKLKPDAVFHYEIGDEYGPQSLTPKADTSYGDGSVVFLSGSPATMQESYAVYGGSITGLDEMPVSKFFEIVEKSQ